MTFIVQHPPARVLVACDDPPLRDLITTRLAISGYQVASARTRGETLEALDSVRPQAMVLEMRLPSFGGLELLSTISQTGAVRRTAVLVLSEAPRVDEAQTAIRLGARDYMGHPFVDEVFLARVRRLLSPAGGKAVQNSEAHMI